jgi:hypothetical protein
MLVTKYYLDDQTVVDGISWICKLNGGEENACVILIRKPEQKKEPEFPGKAGEKLDQKIISTFKFWVYGVIISASGLPPVVRT